MENIAKVFRKADHLNLRLIIDCSKVFIERPKFLDAQVATWSDYKSHNTVKFLSGILSTGYILFLSVIVVDQVINSSLLIVDFTIVSISIMK